MAGVASTWGKEEKNIIRICATRENRVCQGDIIENVKYIEEFKEFGDYINVSVINFPYIVVLSQDCDLNEDYEFRNDIPKKHKDHDKIMFSLLVAPLYNADHVLSGEHLSLLDLKMQDLRKEKDKTPKSIYDQMKINQVPRYHHLKFPKEVEISDSFIDFKHYFSANIIYLENLKKTNFVCTIGELYRESVSQRFSNYLSRIGLP